MQSTLSLLLILGLVGCDSSGFEFRPKNTGVPAVVDLGEFPVVSPDEVPGDGITAGVLDGMVHYGELGAPDPGVTGGATFTFAGTGGPVCVVLDPEAVYWTKLESPQADRTSGFAYDDNVQDDADVDLQAGLSAYYTGSPGVEIGDFEAIYTDQMGQDHEIVFNECLQTGYSNTPNVHGGRGTVEYCEIDTDQRGGVAFTVVVKTFMVPIDDSIANYAVGVFDGPCQALAPEECFFRDEYTLGESSDYFSELEDAFCGNARKLNNYCEDHLEDDNPPCLDR